MFDFVWIYVLFVLALSRFICNFESFWASKVGYTSEKSNIYLLFRSVCTTFAVVIRGAPSFGGAENRP